MGIHGHSGTQWVYMVTVEPNGYTWSQWNPMGIHGQSGTQWASNPIYNQSGTHWNFDPIYGYSGPSGCITNMVTVDLNVSPI